MFLLDTNTVRLLYQAQQKKLQGKVRLDVSSQRLPQDPLNLDEDAAREALGERLLRSLTGLANDAFMQKSGWKVPPPQPPVPDANNLIRVLPSKSQFESYLVSRLDQVMGLNHKNEYYPLALEKLANDLFTWVGNKKAEAEAHRLLMNQQEVFMRCLPYPQVHKALDGGTVLEIGPVWRSPQP